MRADLSSAQQAVQGTHAALCFAAQYPGEWHDGALVLLSVPSQQDLRDLLFRLAIWEWRHAPFHEPDWGYQLTAVAAGPEAAKYLARYPLALGEGVTT